MFRRWLIRSLFLLPLAFLVAIWITSYFGAVVIAAKCFHHIWELGVFQGEIDGFRFSPSGTSLFGFYPNTTPATWNSGANRWHFAFGTHPRVTSVFGIAAPLWLPTLLLTAFTFFAWRKTRPKPIGHAFPIDPAAKPESKP